MAEQSESKSLNSRRAKPFSPVLDHILHGGRGIALDMRAMNAKAKARRVFAHDGLNNVIFFKYPAATMPLAAAGRDKSRKAGEAATHAQPVQTGLFMPYDRQRPEDGGTAIYVRQRNFLDMLKVHAGLSADATAIARDLNIIETIEAVQPLIRF